jgi:hypothetical protein
VDERLAAATTTDAASRWKPNTRASEKTSGDLTTDIAEFYKQQIRELLDSAPQWGMAKSALPART